MSGTEVFDRPLFATRRARALREGKAGADFLLAEVVEDLSYRLLTMSRTFPCAVDLGGHTGRVAEMLEESGKSERVLRGDLFLPDPNIVAPDFVFDDAFVPLKDDSIDLIVSALSLQWVNDLTGTLIQIRRALKPDGLFLGTLFGGETLQELRDVLMRAELEISGGAAPRVAPFADIRDLGGLLQRAGFAMPVTDLDKLTVRYDNMFMLMADLKAMGATSVLVERSHKPLPRSVFLRAAELYAGEYADQDGRIRATFQFASLQGWAPDPSQQKPLRPGSVSARLADMLDTEEVKLKR